MGVIVPRMKEYIQTQAQPQDQCLEIAASWLRNRLSGRCHIACQDIRQGSGRTRLKKPTRLLFLDQDRPHELKLISVAKRKAYQYATLSHRWGIPEPPRLSKHNNSGHQKHISIKDLEAGIAISDLPRLFREAIQIVKHCGLQYIWIDCLCILQDKNPEDHNNPDWEKEATKMADIYAGGVFNIAATQAQNSEAGLFQTRRGLVLPVVRPAWRPGEDASEAILLWEDPGDKFKRDVSYSELLSRGWVFQEVFFTPANLFCTPDEMWWSCCRSTCSQSFPKGVVEWVNTRYSTDPTVIFFEDESRMKKAKFYDLGRGNSFEALLVSWQDVLESWQNVLESYGWTSVTVESDRLVAIAGVASIFRTMFPNQLRNAGYHSGVWSTMGFENMADSLAVQLFWQGLSFPARRYSAGHPIPSWSPMSFAGEVGYISSWGDRLIELVAMESSHLDKFGRAMEKTHCTLHIRGVLTGVDITQEEKDELWGLNRAHVTNHPELYMDIAWDNKEELRQAAESKSKDYARVLPLELIMHRFLFRLNGILLRPLDDVLSNNGPRAWVRCGTFKLVRRKELFDSWRHVLEFFQVEKYGLKWKLPESRGLDARCDRVSKPYGLEDIYIV